MTNAINLETLKQEQALLTQRALDSKREADSIRAQMQAYQAALNTAEESFNNAQQTVATLEQQLNAARVLVGQRQAELQQAHQQAGQFAQQLGPAAQKQKRFEEALQVVESNIQLALGGSPQSKLGLGGSLSAGAPNRLIPQSPFARPPQAEAGAVPPSPPTLGGPPGLPTPPAPPSNEAPQSGAVRAPRAALRIEMSFQLDIHSESAHNFYTGFTNNISEGGVFIATSHLLDIGTHIKFPIKLPNMEVPELVEGIVRWVRRDEHVSHMTPSGLGVQFTQISDALRHQINVFIQQHESIFYED